MRQWTSDQWLRNIDQVLEARQQRARGEIRAQSLKDVIKAAGFWPTESGLLADGDLRLQCDFLKLWSYDWMHTAFQDGFMSNAMWLVSSNINRIKQAANISKKGHVEIESKQASSKRIEARISVHRDLFHA